MKLRLPVVLALATFAWNLPVVPVHAEDLDVKIDRMKIKEDKEDVAEDRAAISKWQQVVAERKAARDTAKGNYEGNLKKSGAKHELTTSSKDRLESAERSLRRAEKKLAKAQEALAEDEKELSEAYQMMTKDKRD